MCTRAYLPTFADLNLLNCNHFSLFDLTHSGSPYNYANLIASEGGSLKWWNIYSATPLVGSFNATTDGDDESVLAIGTNTTDKILATADTRVRTELWVTTDGDDESVLTIGTNTTDNILTTADTMIRTKLGHFVLAIGTDTMDR